MKQGTVRKQINVACVHSRLEGSGSTLGGGQVHHPFTPHHQPLMHAVSAYFLAGPTYP